MWAEAVIDLGAVEANVAVLTAATFAQQTRAQVLAVVTADGYGHGLLPTARAALAGGANWLGTAGIDEALALRAAGVAAPIFAWLWTPGQTDAVRRAVAAGIDLSVSARWQLAQVLAAANESDVAGRIHLGVDTGAGRFGAAAADWPDLLDAVAKAQAGGEVEVIGIWSGLAHAGEPGHPANDEQLTAFHAAAHTAALHGVVPLLRHLANSAATLTMPGTHLDLVRAGAAVYGLSPVPRRGDFGLVPAMTLRAEVAHTSRTGGTSLAMVPLGYADGIARTAAAGALVSINGHRCTIMGPVGTEHVMVDIGDLPVVPGDIVVLFGPGRHGEPLARDWAVATDTVPSEIVTRIGPRVPRRHLGGMPWTTRRAWKSWSRTGDQSGQPVQR